MITLAVHAAVLLRRVTADAAQPRCRRRVQLGRCCGGGGRAAVGEGRCRGRRSAGEGTGQPVTDAAIASLRWYKRTISPLLPPAAASCRPASTRQSFQRFSPPQAPVPAAWRLVRCNPTGGGRRRARVAAARVQRRRHRAHRARRRVAREGRRRPPRRRHALDRAIAIAVIGATAYAAWSLLGQRLDTIVQDTDLRGAARRPCTLRAACKFFLRSPPDT